jgi:opacity protein-like surface antigen
MKMLAGIVAGVVTLFGSTVAMAEDPAWSVGFAAGRFWPDTSSGEGPRKAVDPGLIGELRLGWRAPVGLALELAVGGFHIEGPMPAVDVTETELQTLSATWLATTFKGWHRLGSDRLRAFAGIGVAYYRFEAHLKDPPSSRRNASETDLGAHLTAGLEFDLTPRFALGLEYRGLSIEPSDQLGGNTAVYSASGNAALLSAAYRF